MQMHRVPMVMLNSTHVSDEAIILLCIVHYFKCVCTSILSILSQCSRRYYAEALHVLMSCIFHRYHKKTEASFYDDVLEHLGSSRADNFELCALGTTENSLVTCQVSVTRKHVMHVMPALGPSLEDRAPKTEQVTL